MMIMGIVLYYIYNDDELLVFVYDHNTYYYRKNIFSDIIGILDSNYNEIVSYAYDSYGNILSIVDNSGIDLGTINPFRFRSYYYDNETGLGGTQESGWKFGEGFSANSKNNAYISNTYGGAGGGSGWYGGSFARNGGWQGAGGGSGFVLTRDSATKVPNGYSVTSEYYLKNALTQAGNELIPTHNHETTMTGNSGNGFAKITILEYDALQIADLSLNYLSTGNYEVVIPNEEFEATISYNNSSVIWSSGTGKVTLKVGTIHEVILMDDNGSISVYNIKVLGSKVYLDNVIFDNIDFKFDKQRYLYEFNVSNDINEINPNVVVSDDVTYKISKTTLNVGKNVIEITALKDGFTSSTYTFIINREYAKTLEPITNTFDYTGDYQEFVAPYTGEYLLEVWGAGGGGQHQTGSAGVGGLGGYSKGIVTLKKGDTLYGIAKQYGLSVDDLKKMNNLTSNTLSINQKLLVSGTSTGGTPSTSQYDKT